MTRPSEERRQHPRSRRGVRVVDQPDDGLLNSVDNISCSGVLCHTRRPVPEMTKLEIVLEIPLQPTRTVRTEGVVIRCDAEEPDHTSFRVAILYTKISDEDLKSIQLFVAHDLENPGT